MAQTNPIIEKLWSQFGSAIQAVEEFRGETTVTVAPKDVASVAGFLRDDPELRFDHLEDVSSVDRSRYPGLGAAPRFAVIYQLISTRSGQRIRLKAPVSGDSPSAPTLTGLWPGANWSEREIYDLMGIRFDGHPDLRRILLPNDWPNHPLRKDVARGGETVPFSMTWEDAEFASFGQQIVEAKAVPQVPPKQADANRHMIMNLGPQHPATHGVLRVVVELDGERVVAAYPDVGYLHSGF